MQVFKFSVFTNNSEVPLHLQVRQLIKNNYNSFA